MQKARWSTAVATAALLAMPVAGSAQSTQSTPEQNPPAQQQSQAASGQADANAAKTHLGEARDTLSQLTSLPEAAKLQGDARTKVSAIISDFNALITTQSDWRSAYAKVDADLTAALGAESDAAAGQPNQPVGTSGSTAPAPATGATAASGGAQIDPAIRAKLVEFRTHLKAFEQAAGGAAAASPSNAVNTSNGANASDPANAASANPASANPASANPTSANPTGTAGTMSPSVATGSTANPAQPGQPQPAGTSGVSPASPNATMDPADRAKAESAVSAATASAPNADAQKELDAISQILSKSRTGTLTKAQTAQLKQHVEILRVLLAQK